MGNPVIAANKVAAQQRRILDTLSAQSAPKIIAYHGSPHDFDRFDASKIGTGEGAQAYGHGLYFAGAEGTAKTYRDISPAVPSGAAAKAIQQLQQRAVQLELEASGIWDAMQRAADERGSLSPGWGAIRGVPQDVQDALGPRLRAINEQLSSLRLEQQRVRDGLRGHMYEVELGTPEDAFLDWDRPLSTPAAAAGAAIVRERNPAAMPLPILRAIEDGSWRFESFPGRNPFDGAAHNIARTAKSAEGAKALLEAGVPGVRYLDGSSRSAGTGTRNYVMFPGTEDRIRILRKYGLLGPAAAGAAVSQDGQ